MQTVTLKPLHHRGQECIGIYFENSSKLNGAIRKGAGAQWSQTHKCWYVPLSGKIGDTDPPFSEQTDPPKLTAWQVHKKSCFLML